jgi:hypothetical protein
MTGTDPGPAFVLGLSSRENASLCFRCRESLSDKGELQGPSNAGTELQQQCCGGMKEYTLPCGCRSHYDCLAAYIQYQINNRNFLRPTEQQGILSCPYGQSCPAVDDLLTLSDIEQIVAQSPCDSPLALDLVKLRGWLAASEEEAQRLLAESDSEKARRIGELDPYVIATTKACPTCSFRSSHVS